jgi:hypothetical protein
MQLHNLFPNLYYSWTERLDMAKQDLARLIPPGHRFILVDESQWGGDLLADRQSIPFLERDGLYWGRPPDDEAAIGELERLRALDASFIVFGWHTTWWLDYYARFQEYICSKFRCVLMNSQLTVFDLKQ